MRRPANEKPLERVETTTVGRGMRVAGLTVKAGARAAGHALRSLLGDKRHGRRQRDEFWTEQMAALVDELGKLKGSLMKVGQLISMYGDYFLEPKHNKILKRLQADSTPVAWNAIESQLARELGSDFKMRLRVEEGAYAAASLGQVHLAKVTGNDRQLCVKIQYPGMRRAVASDLATLKPLLAILRGRSHKERFDDLLVEFRSILDRELDYRLERQALEQFRVALGGDARFVLPETLPEFCAERVLTTTFVDGVPPDHPTVLALPQSRRNALGAALLDLYFFEIFQMRLVQTDPHFGNFRIQVGEGDAPDRLVLLDFGSMREVSPGFAAVYADYVAGAFLRDANRVEQAALKMGLLLPSDAPEARRELFELTGVLMEPLKVAESARGGTDSGRALEDFPDLIAAKTRRFVAKIGMRPPPRELLLLDRKLLGVFVFLATLRAVVPGRAIIGRHTPL